MSFVEFFKKYEKEEVPLNLGDRPISYPHSDHVLILLDGTENGKKDGPPICDFNGW